MNTDRHDHHAEAGFEHEDLSSSGVYGFLIGLIVLCGLIQFVILGTLHLFEKYNRTHQPRQNPLVQTQAETRSVTPATIERFPQPRLEDDERTELREFRLREAQALNRYTADPATGATRIPIEVAMRLIVERGLPTAPQAGTAPTSVVDTVKQAAAKADGNSKTPAGKPKK